MKLVANPVSDAMSDNAHELMGAIGFFQTGKTG